MDWAKAKNEAGVGLGRPGIQGPCGRVCLFFAKKFCEIQIDGTFVDRCLAL